MGKKAKAKKAKGKKAPKKARAASTPKLVPLTRSGLRQLGAQPAAQPGPRGAMAGAAGGGAQSNEVLIIPGIGGTTIVCFRNPNTGNFDDCHTVQGSVGIRRT